jgi:hypothetical protein
VEALEALLRRPRYELMPTEGVEDLVVGAVPPEVKLIPAATTSDVLREYSTPAPVVVLLEGTAPIVPSAGT